MCLSVEFPEQNTGMDGGITGTIDITIIYNEAKNIEVRILVDIVTKEVLFYLHNGTNKTKYYDIATAVKHFYLEVYGK